ncbi:MAG: hypothetical protein CME70_12820 [Halobacteriovorax sp.]|nr:hypothetical protein [Halobacteriovorax sp.]|tara:strand:+ start:170335 stop:170727 length:393 start_codon:yes stop_codon:yes gene_type:complete
MNKLFSILLFVTLSFTSFSQAKAQSELTKLQEIKKVTSKETNQVFKTFRIANKSLEKKMDDKIVKEVARIYTLLHKVDENYYTVEPFSKLLKVKNSPFKAKMKKFLPKKDYEIFEENVESLLNEMNNGNG